MSYFDFRRISHSLDHISIESTDSRNQSPYNLTLSHKLSLSNNYSSILLFVPGFFQNANLLNLDEEEGLSFINDFESQASIKIYCLNPRGTMGSDYPKKSCIDDIAIDDINAAVEYLYTKYQRKIHIMGHSQGAITTQAYLAGLTRSPNGNIFDLKTSQNRQNKIRTANLLAGSCSMQGNNPLMDRLSKIAVSIKPLILTFDLIPAPFLTRFLVPSIISDLPSSSLWNFLYEKEVGPYKLSQRVQNRLYDLTFDHSATRIVLQFAHALLEEKGLRNTSGEFYVDHLSNINLPIYQITFSKDPMAGHEETYHSSFQFIGSELKQYEILDGLGHEDIFMYPELFDRMKNLITFIKSHTL